MADIAHVVGVDLQIGPTGDLATIDGDGWTQQRILRRLLTNQGAYIWQLTYGGGLPGMVGATVSAQQVAAVIRQQIGLESAVASNPEPQVVVQSDQIGNVFATVAYQDAQTGSPQILTVPRTG